MKLTIESTDEIVEINEDFVARVWNGTSESGAHCKVIVAGIALPDGEMVGEFARELVELLNLSDSGARVELQAPPPKDDKH